MKRDWKSQGKVEWKGKKAQHQKLKAGSIAKRRVPLNHRDTEKKVERRK
jgi:hypothetical protein